MQMLAQELPRQMIQYQEVTRKNNEARDAFYKAWPQLNEKEHGKHVLDVGRMFRQMNPNATPEEATTKIGQIVTAALNLPPAAQQPPVQQQQRPAARPGFRPAATGQAASGAPPASDNLFTQMAEEMLHDDSGG